MNQKLMPLIACWLVTASASAQTVYYLPPNTNGNQLALTISNESSTTTAEQVEVKAVKYPQTISFQAVPRPIESIAPQGERAVIFTFDVGRSAPMNTTDTLEFLIIDRGGATWEKSILVSYMPPAAFALEQNFPNPFNPSTTIYYQLPTESKVTLKVYDALGQEASTLVDEEQSAGYREVLFNASGVARQTTSGLASGLYFYRITAQPLNGTNPFISIRKMMLVK